VRAFSFSSSSALWPSDFSKILERSSEIRRSDLSSRDRIGVATTDTGAFSDPSIQSDCDLSQISQQVMQMLMAIHGRHGRIAILRGLLFSCSFN